MFYVLKVALGLMRGKPRDSAFTQLFPNLGQSEIGVGFQSVRTKEERVSTPLFLLLFACIAAAAAKSLQSCPTLCDPIDGSPPGSAIPGILQARTLECIAISFSNA